MFKSKSDVMRLVHFVARPLPIKFDHNISAFSPEGSTIVYLNSLRPDEVFCLNFHVD